MRTKGYKCSNVKCNSCVAHCMCGELGDIALSCSNRIIAGQTNADRIRAMSDEELAKWLVQKTVYQESAWSPPSYLNFMTGLDDTIESAIKGTTEWLQQSAKETEWKNLY